MTDAVTERRRRRAAAQELFDTLAGDYFDLPGISRASMFGSQGLQINTKFFAFVGRDGQLIIKLPAVRAADLVATAHATAVQAGRGTTREWVGIAKAADDTAADQWRTLLADAHRYVAALTSRDRTASPPDPVP